MTDTHDFFAPPPFKPTEALQRLQRDLRLLGLVERAGTFERQGQAWVTFERQGQAWVTFERQGQAWVTARSQDGVLEVALAKAPARTPQWQPRTLKDNAQLRDFIAAVKQQLARHDERSE